jgi:uncharacterized protein YhdP
MRRLLLVAAALATLVVVAAVLAVANLNRVVERNRERIVAEITKGFGRPVGVGAITVGFRRGIAVELTDLRVADDPAFSSEPFLTVASTHAIVRLWPLVRGRFEVRRVVASAAGTVIRRWRD